MTVNQMEKFHTKPGKLIVAGLIVIGIFFGGLGGISATMPFSGAVIAPGLVKISDERKTVQHLEGGIVDQILVKEGDTVKRGQILIRLKSSQIDASVTMFSGMLSAKLAQLDRLSAEKNMDKTIVWSTEIVQQKSDPEINAILKKEQEIFDSRLGGVYSKLVINQARIRQLEEKIVGITSEIESRRLVIASINEEIAIKEPLLKENYIDQSGLLQLKRELYENRSNLAAKQQLIAESNEKIKELEFFSIDLKNNFKEKAVAELGQVNEAIFKLQEELRPRIDARQRLAITAPVDGDVINLQIHSEKGGVIRPGEPLLDIVPTGAKLVIECKLRQDKITQVKEGQKTKIQLSAFNRITTPPLDGKVIYVSPDTMMENTPQGPTPFYILHVLPLEGELEKNKAWLLSGMPAACFVETERRTFLQYLIEPIVLNIDRSLKESL